MLLPMVLLLVGGRAVDPTLLDTQEECVEPSCEYLPCAKEVGTCRVFGCRTVHGPTDCNEGACLCKPGICTGDGFTCNRFQGTCKKLVGSCRLLGCSAKHGPTQCLHGKCLCEVGTCTTDGVTCAPAAAGLSVGLLANSTLTAAEVRELQSDAQIAQLEDKVDRLTVQLTASVRDRQAYQELTSVSMLMAFVSAAALGLYAAVGYLRGRGSRGVGRLMAEPLLT